MVGSYFSERKALAYGISMSGSGIGTFILAPVVQLLIERFTWRGALLILGGLVSHLCVCGALMRPLEGQSKRQKTTDLEHNKKVESQRTECSVQDIMQLAEKSEMEKYKNADVESAQNPQRGGKEHMHTHSSEVLKQKLSKCSETINTNMNELNRDLKLTIRDLVQSHDSLSGCLSINRENTTIPESRSQSIVSETALVLSNTKMLDETTNTNLCCKLRDTIMRETSFLLIPDFLLLLVSFLFLAYGCSVPFVYLVPYSLNAGVSPQQAPLLMSILGISGIVGTITFGWIADRK